jgi:hypothetical protein
MAVPISCNTVDFMNAETSNLRVPTITSTMDSGTERQLAFYPSGGYLCIYHNGGWGPANKNNFEFKVSGSGLNWDGTTLRLDSSAFLTRQYDSTAEYGQQYYYDFKKNVVRGMRIAKNTTDYISESGELYLDANNYLRMGDSTGNRAIEITDTGFGLDKSQDGVLSLMLGTGLTFSESGYRELCVDTAALDSKYLSLSGGGTVSGTTSFAGITTFTSDSTVMFSGSSTTFTGSTMFIESTTFSGATTFTTKPTLEVGFITYVGSEITLGDDSLVTLNGSTDSSASGGITLTGTANLNTASGVLTLPTGDNAAVHQTGMVYFTDHADSPTLQIYSAIQGKWVEVGGSSSGDYLPLSGGTLTGNLIIQNGMLSHFFKDNIIIGETPGASPSTASDSYVYIGQSSTANYTSHVCIGECTTVNTKSNVIIGKTNSWGGDTEVSIGNLNNSTSKLSSSSSTKVSIGHISASMEVYKFSSLTTTVSIGQVDATAGAMSTVTFGGGPCKVLFGSGAVFIVPVGLSTYFTASEGQIYFNSTDKKFYGYNGTEWKALAYES